MMTGGSLVPAIDAHVIKSSCFIKSISKQRVHIYIDIDIYILHFEVLAAEETTAQRASAYRIIRERAASSATAKKE